MIISLLDSESDSLPKPVEVTWSELVASLKVPVYTPCLPCPGKDCPLKKGRAWIPAAFPTGAKRLDSEVQAITVAVLDLDEPTPEDLAYSAQALDGFEYACHQTHRGNGYRILIRLEEPIPVEEWPRVWAAIAARFAKRPDTTCKNPSHLYFVPTRPEGTGYAFYTGEGRPLAAADLDLEIKPAEALSIAKAALEPEISGELDPGPVDLDALRASVKSMRSAASSKLLSRILDGQPFAVPGGSAPQGDLPAGRDVELNRACSLVATSPIKRPYAVDVALGLLEPSIRAMDCSPEGPEHWLALAKVKYQKALARRWANDKRTRDARDEINRVLGSRDQPLAPEGDDWRRGLLYSVKDGEQTGLKQVGANANLIFTAAPDFFDQIRFNDVTREIEVTGGPLLDAPKASLDTEAANWLARSEFKLALSTSVVGEQLVAVARRHTYDPLADWLKSLRWDRVPRISTFFQNYFNAAPPFGDVELIERISRAFLISCVARAMQPGCWVQTIPILTGAQGVGKTRAIMALGAPFATSTSMNFESKDATLLTSRMWLIELAELASLNKGTLEQAKDFLSRPSDMLRPPYGRVLEPFLRRCVYIGTTNQEEFLFDETGNRRFWPIRVGACLVEMIERDRDQLFAEAMVAYSAGEKWHLPKALAARAENVALTYMVPSARGEQICRAIIGQEPKRRPTELTSYDAAHALLGIPAAQIDERIQRECGRAMSLLGFEKKRKRLAGKPIWYYVVPDVLLMAQKSEAPRTEIEHVAASHPSPLAAPEDGAARGSGQGKGG